MYHCRQLLPLDVHYEYSRFQFIVGIQVTTGIPVYQNIVEKWYLDQGVTLPAGLTLNSVTGEISGKPQSELELKAFTVYAENQSGVVLVSLSIGVRKGTCKAEGLFPVTAVGDVAVYECSAQGSYVGTQKRECVLGTEDGVWKNASGLCMSIALIVTVIVVVIVVIAIVILVLVRVNKRAKATGRVRAKKMTKKQPKHGEKKTVKELKVYGCLLLRMLTDYLLKRSNIRS